MTRILIADPNAAPRKALALLLSRRLGVSDIAEAEDVETLVRNLSESSGDLLLLDWTLYGAPAPEACRLLRKAYPLLIIVLLSVNAEDEQAARSAGAAFIHKGASPETVVAVLEPLLKSNPDSL